MNHADIINSAQREAGALPAETTRKGNGMEKEQRKVNFKNYIEGFIRRSKMPAIVAAEYSICQEVGKCLKLSAEEMQAVAREIDGVQA